MRSLIVITLLISTSFGLVLPSVPNHGVLPGLAGQGTGGGADDHDLGSDDSPGFTGLTITGNSVFGLNSSVFQPTTNSTTFGQWLDAAGASILNLDSTNRQVTVGQTSVTYPLVINSTDGSDQIKIHHDNLIAWIRWTDGPLRLQSVETANSNTIFEVRGNGTGVGAFYVFDAQGRYIANNCTSGVGQLRTVGTNAGRLQFQHTAHSYITMFEGATSGETQQLYIHGYRSGDANRRLAIGVGVDAADTVSFDDVSNYQFYGNIITKDDTHSDADGAGATSWTAKRERSGGEEADIFSITGSHDGAADDQLGKYVIGVNTGSGVVDALEIGSDLLATFAGAGDFTAAAEAAALTIRAGDDSSEIRLEIGETGAASAYFKTLQSGAAIVFKDSADDINVVIQDDGLVGFGTASPGQEIELFGDGALMAYNFPTDTSFTGIEFNENDVVKGYVLYIGSNYATAARRNMLELRSTGGISFWPDNAVADVVIKGDGTVGIGASAPVSLLEVDGAQGLAIETVTGNTTLDITHSTLLVNASGNVTITLPTAASAYNSTDGIGRIYTVKKIDADSDTVTLDPDGSEEIEFALTVVITERGESITFHTNGTAWYIL